MTKATCTPGPWTCDNKGLVAGRDKNHPDTPSFDIFDAEEWPGAEDEAMANAHLVGAALGLLESLEWILPLAKGYAAQNDHRSNWGLIKAAESMITKARGEDS